jgi:N-methylhydantoinase A
LRTTVTGVMAKPPLAKIAGGKAEPDAASRTGSRKVYFASAGGFVDTPSFTRAKLLAGNRITGPALIEEHASTTVLLPGDVVTVDPSGNLVIEIFRS